MELLLILLIALLPVLALLPLALTVVNLYNLFAKDKIRKTAADIATLAAGVLLTLLLYAVWVPVDWMEPLYDMPGGILPNLHAPVATWLEGSLLAAGGVALLGYCLLRFRPDKLPPLISVACLSACYLGCGLGAVWCIQLFPNLLIKESFQITLAYLLLFPINFMILTISLVRELAAHAPRQEEESSPVLKTCARILENSKNWPVLAFVFLWVLMGALVMVLTLFGQPPDALVKAFTQTSDWTFSQQVSPPPVPYDGHYLCTVAAQGHPKVVKPQRMGKRHGHPIVVNRQLCIANAFEDYLAEKLPRFHRWIRGLYDQYGYPLSRHIRTPLAADVTYWLMKPLEWGFLLFLYTFDLQPEKRISRQYLP